MIDDVVGFGGDLSFVDSHHRVDMEFQQILALLNAVVGDLFGHPGAEPDVGVAIREELDDDHGDLLDDPGVCAEE